MSDGAGYRDRMRLRLAVPVLVGAVSLAAACTSDGGSAAAPSASASASAPASPGGSEVESPTPSPTAALPAGCDLLLPFTDLDRALGRPLFGESAFVKGVAQSSIGRTGRVTCRYGLARGGRGVAPVEVGVSTYRDVESAMRRVQATISAQRGQGATQSEATISGVPATLLGTRTAVLVVLAQGSRTVAVTLQRSLRGDVGRAAVAVTEKVLTNLEQ